MNAIAGTKLSGPANLAHIEQIRHTGQGQRRCPEGFRGNDLAPRRCCIRPAIAERIRPTSTRLFYTPDSSYLA